MFGISTVCDKDLYIREPQSIRVFARKIGFRQEVKKKELSQLVFSQGCRGHEKASYLLRVVSIKDGVSKTGDIEVEGVHHYMIGGISSHNTGKIRCIF